MSTGKGVVSYQWRPIEDLPPDWGKLAQPELAARKAAWEELQPTLSPQALAEFLERLKREWSIETGIIERVYSLDEGITEVLIEKGIETSLIPFGPGGKAPEQVAAIIQDQKAAIDAIFDFVKGDRKLSTAYIKELHAQITRHQLTVTGRDQFARTVEMELLHGAYKIRPNNPTRSDGALHEYCPPEHVAAQMDRLVAMHDSHAHVPPEVAAAWLHHRFAQIHPFQDGNGRVARALATAVFVKGEYFPLTMTRNDRDAYIAALEAADAGALEDLVTLFAANAKKWFLRALSIASALSVPKAADQIIEAARDELARRQGAQRREWERAKDLAKKAQRWADERLGQICEKLTEQTREYAEDWRFRTDREGPGQQRGHWFRWQVIETAKRLRYFADTTAYQAWSRLVLGSGRQSQILIAFHGVGHEFRGNIVVSACFFAREEDEDGNKIVGDVTPLSDEAFQMSHRESPGEIKPRFRRWLEECLVRGLESWRKGL